LQSGRRRRYSGAMFKVIPNLLDAAGLAALSEIANRATFVDGRISNPHNKAKNNLQTYDAQAAERLGRALMENEDFRNFAFPAKMVPPVLSRYDQGMEYGWHADAATLDPGTGPVRADLSCTIFLSSPSSYGGGSLIIGLGDAEFKIRGPAGTAIVYPSHTFHRVEPVTSGARLVGLTFIQSRIASAHHREILYDLNEVAALEGTRMDFQNYSRLQLVQRNLLNAWSDPPR
jgi:PKHD-type hydroxylase